jgi:hypothetical protein
VPNPIELSSKDGETVNINVNVKGDEKL